MKIALVDVVGSNIGSLSHCLQRLGYQQGEHYDFARSPEALSCASHVILAGVGSAHKAMSALSDYGLTDMVRELTVPVLGICVGMQILYESSDEDHHGRTLSCLGVLRGAVRQITPPQGGAIIHNGWNQLEKHLGAHQNSQKFWCYEGEYVYFVHQYGADPCGQQDILYAHYGQPIPALVQKDNFVGMQFHPEKSAEIGQQILGEFLR